MPSSTALGKFLALAALSSLPWNSLPAAAQPSPVPTGRYGAVMEYDSSRTPAQTVYRPRDLSNARDIPIIAWGNGGCRNNGGADSRQFLMEVASHGYMIIAPGKPGPDRPVEPTTDHISRPRTDNPDRGEPEEAAPAAGRERAGGGARAPRGEDRPDRATQDKSTPENLKAGLDWAIAENARPGSAYFHKLAPASIAVMGRSCGGLQTIALQGDPRLKTAIVWNSGTFEAPTRGGNVGVTKDDLKKIHVPIAYILGGPDDVAWPQANADLALINHVPLFFGSIPVGHPGTMAQANGGSNARVAIAWLNWQLKGDQKASTMFRGADCTLCKDPNWTIKQKNLN